MSKSNIIVAILIVIVVVGLSVVILSSKKSSEISQQVKVATTIFPLYDIVRNIAGNKTEVVNILPSGASPHTFELTPQILKELQGASVAFTIGHGIDNWVNDLSESLSGIKIITVDKNVRLKTFQSENGHEEDHALDEFDPHYWLSTDNAKIIAQTIAHELSTLNSENTGYYQNNLDAYLSELDEVSNNAIKALSTLPNNNLITIHDAWSYLGDELNFSVVGTFQPTPGIEPTPQQLTELQEIIVKYGVKALFSEPQLSAEIVQPFANDTGLDVYILDPLGGVENRQSYIELIQYNVDTIYEALQ
ncbi:metal ABC transporter substrate-binding protein [Patescibacteria group bacterium]